MSVKSKKSLSTEQTDFMPNVNVAETLRLLIVSWGGVSNKRQGTQQKWGSHPESALKLAKSMASDCKILHPFLKRLTLDFF